MSQRKFNRAKQKTVKEKSVKPSTPEQSPSVKAMVWYREEHWETLVNLFTDADKLPKSYNDWHGRAVEMQERMQAEGHAVIKVYIDPETFPGWCESKGLSMDANARSQLAIEVAQAQSFHL
jgi:hypothetical protein